ncbi:Small heat shock protein [Fulvivirga imtechensis AK7]|uniref:Small heat shock protein n=1 Tax=Fulvivirga imtechensis AK7 TaxID=1237149 RepID=L8JZW0_9BACT|nr:Hsp20/alpha crystallin family protein [Fulvivirga imtechensis]ELR73224.1 Small heat shock protein [Fulvivirga imtechensis AK7]
MSLIRRNGDLFNLPSLFDDFFTRDFNRGGSSFSSTGTSIPAVNIRETNDDFEVEMAAPGMTKKDFRIELDGTLLTISSERGSEREENEGNYNRREFSYQSFQRSFTLPKEVVDIDKIKAKYENGMLYLRIPKREEAKQKPPRVIDIS